MLKFDMVLPRSKIKNNAAADNIIAVDTKSTTLLCSVNICLLFLNSEATYDKSSLHTIKPMPPNATSNVDVIRSVALVGGMIPLSKSVTPGALQNEAIA